MTPVDDRRGGEDEPVYVIRTFNLIQKSRWEMNHDIWGWVDEQQENGYEEVYVENDFREPWLVTVRCAKPRIETD